MTNLERLRRKEKPCTKCGIYTDLVGQNGHISDYRECLNCKKDREIAYDNYVDPLGAYREDRYSND